MAYPDNPIISRIMRTGYPDNREEPRCPVCDSDLSATLYKVDGEIVGCQDCVSIIDIWDFCPDEEYPKCPVCGSPSASEVIKKDGKVVGCDECVSEVDIYDWQRDHDFWEDRL